MQYTSLFASRVSRFVGDGQLIHGFRSPTLASGRLAKNSLATPFVGGMSGFTAEGGSVSVGSGGNGSGISMGAGAGGFGTSSGNGNINITTILTIIMLSIATVLTKGAAAPKLAGKLASFAPAGAKKIGTAIKSAKAKTTTATTQNSAKQKSLNMGLSDIAKRAASRVPGVGQAMGMATKGQGIVKKFGMIDGEGNTESDTRQSQPPYWKIVGSSTIQALMYDPNTGILNVRFLNGTEYTYDDVPQAVFSVLLAQDSKGSYFYWNIRGAGVPVPYAPPYVYTRVR